MTDFDLAKLPDLARLGVGSKTVWLEGGHAEQAERKAA